MFKILHITNSVGLNNVNKFFKENEGYINVVQMCSSDTGIQVLINGEESIVDKISLCCEYPIKEDNLDDLLP